MIDMGSAQGNLKLSATDFLAAIDQSIERLNNLKQASSQASTEVEKVGNSESDAGKKSEDFGNKEKDTADKTKGLGDKTKDTDEKVKTFAETLKGAGDKLQDYGSKISKSGGTLTKYITTPIVAAAGYATKVATSFESAMSTVKAISGASDEDMGKLSEKAKEMGQTTVFSATEAAEALKYMAMAGWKTDEMLSGISGVMALAAASGEDLGTTSDIVTDALTAFGLSAKDSAHFADVLAAASNNSNTNVSMLGEAFKYCAPIAGTFGYTIEDMAVALGLMANNGIKSSQAGTTLRSAFTRLAKPTKEMQKSLDDMGIKLTDSSGQMKPLSELLGDLREGFSKLNAEEQAETATILFGKTAMSGMLAVLRTSEEDYNKLTTAINGAEGSATKMSEIKLDNFQGQLTLLKSNLESVGIKFGNLILPYLKDFISGLGSVVTWIGNLDEGTKKTIITAGALLAALGPVLKIFGNITKAAGGLLKMFSLMAAHPVVAAVAALAVGIVAVTTAMTSNIEVVEEDYNAYKDFSEGVRNAATEFKNLKEARKKAIQDTNAEFDHYEALKTELDKIVDADGKIKKGYEDRAKFITNELSEALDIEIKNNGTIIENYKEISKQIDKSISKKRVEAQLEAYRESYTTAIKNQTEAQKNLTTAEQHRNEAKQKLVELETQIKNEETELAALKEKINPNNEDVRKMNELNTSIENGKNKLGQYRNELSNANTDWLAAKNTYTDYATTIENYENLNTALITGDEVKIKAAQQALVNDFITAKTGTSDQLKAQYNNWEKYYNDLIVMSKQKNSTVTQAMLDEAKNMVTRSKTELDNLKGVGEYAGKSLLTGFTTGITDRLENEKVNNGLNHFTNYVSTTTKKGLGVSSPSKLTKQYGIWFVQGFVNGINNSISMVTPAVESMSNAAEEALFGQGFSLDTSGFGSMNSVSIPYSVQRESFTAGSTAQAPLSSTSNVFNIYSPEPMDAIEAANQIKKVQQQIAEGFLY